MNFRIGALLCLTGMAACSNNPSETAVNDPSDVNQPTTELAVVDPALTPASSDNAVPRATQPAPAAAGEGPAPVSDPVVADTKGTSSDKSTGSAAAPAAAPGAAPAAPGAAPDNTRVNKRDADNAALTPVDQGNDEASLKVTQQIRQALMADGSLSFTAKNVKIITQNGKVTLRGPVKTAQERAAVEAAARKAAGTLQIDNQIEVKK
jgi:hypothetical protein